MVPGVCVYNTRLFAALLQIRSQMPSWLTNNIGQQNGKNKLK